MKRTMQFLLASTLAMSIGSAYATNQATVKVKGTIGTGTCQFVTTDADHTIELAAIDPASISDSAHKQLPSQTITMDVTCAAATSIKLEVKDTTTQAAGNSPIGNDIQFQLTGGGSLASTPRNEYFKLLATNSDILNKPVGAYVMKMGTVKVSNPSTATPSQDATMATSMDARSWDMNINQFITKKDNKFHKPVLSGSTSNNAVGAQFTFPIEIASTIFSKSSLPVTADEVIRFEGTATIDLTIL